MRAPRPTIGSGGTAAAAAAVVLITVLALSATPALAGTPPSVATLVATKGNTALVEGTIAPHLQATEYWADYAPASDEWCTTGGVKGSFERTTSTADEYEGNESRYTKVKIAGLIQGDTYCFELVAENASGETGGGQVSYTVGSPAVQVKEDTLREELEFGPRSATSEALTVEVENEAGNPHYVRVTYDVEYALASSKWCTSHGAEGSAENTSEEWRYDFFDGQEYIIAHHNFVLTGLTSKSEYCARPEATAETIATKESLSNHGQFVSFRAGAPKVTTYGANEKGPTTVAVTGDINPAAQQAEYHVLYAKASSKWCTSDGAEGSPEPPTPVEKLTTEKFAEREVEISGLTKGERYCAEFVVTNPSGSASARLNFRPGAPQAYIEDVPDEEETVQPDGKANYYVNTSVFKHEEKTEEWAEYALASTRWCRTGGEAAEAEATTTPTEVGSEQTGEGEAVFGPVRLPPLPPNTNYCGRLHVKNEAAETTGFFTFKTASAVTFTVKIEGTGSGTVTGKRISCPPTCTAVFLYQGEGKPIQLEAKAAAGSTFAGWTKYSCLFSLETPICLAGNPTATAIFNKNAGSSGGGSGGSQALACSIFQQGLGRVKRPPPAKHGHRKRKRKPATLPVSVRCNASASLTVSGTLTETVKKGHHKRMIRMKLTPAQGTAAAGQTETLAPSLPAKALAALMHGARVSAKLTLSAEGPAGSAHEVVSVARVKLH